MRGALALFTALLLLRTRGFNAESLSDREDAFIGYSERAIECKDRLDNCPAKAKHDGCLKDPYNMRAFCPISCAVSKCIARGTLKVRVKGYATPTDTTAFARRWAARVNGTVAPNELVSEFSGHFRTHKFVGGPLKLSSLGVGTYLGDPDSRTDDQVAAAIIYSVVNGWNVIDTASNYRYGRAEAAVGAALHSLLAGAATEDFLLDGEYSPDVTRSMLFISSKAGFVEQPLVDSLVKARRMSRRDVVNGHTLAPAYLAASVNASLERMGLETIDLLYLHNAAEMQLGTLGRGAFMSKLKEAFSTLESLRAAGWLRSYGLATWSCFRVPPGHPDHLSLQDVVALAREAAGGNSTGFTAIQLPVSASMSEAWSQEWQLVGNSSVSTMRAAAMLGVKVFTSGPLGEGELLRRLTSRLDSVAQLAPQPSSAAKLLQLARSTPGRAMTATLVGHKTREWVVANAALARQQPLEESAFLEAMLQVQAILNQQQSEAAAGKAS